MTTIVEARLQTYRDALENWSARRHRSTTIANRYIDKACEMFAVLRLSKEGREGITRLIWHDDHGVRMWAAGHSLLWAPNEAIPILEEIQAARGFDGAMARITLEQYRSGELQPCGLKPLPRMD